MAIITQSVFDSLQPTNHDGKHPHTIIVTGKGGVGKSTTLAAIARYFSKQGLRCLIADLDGAPNASDSFGLPRETRNQTKRKNSVLEIAENIHAVLVRSILPRIKVGRGESPEEYATKLNALFEKYADQGIHDYLPLLRPAGQSEFYGFPADIKVISHIIQLILIAREHRHIVTDHSAGTMELEKFEKPDILLLDTENTDALIEMMYTIGRFGHSMNNLAQKGMVGQMTLPPNLKTYRGTRIGKNPKAFILNATDLADHFFSDRTQICVVTKPGANDTVQTDDEMNVLVEDDKPPAHLFMNQWPESDHDQEIADQQAAMVRDQIGSLVPGTIGYSQANPGIVHPVLVGSEHFQQDTLANLDRLIACL